jgi:hypothetical protein
MFLHTFYVHEARLDNDVKQNMTATVDTLATAIAAQKVEMSIVSLDGLAHPPDA